MAEVNRIRIQMFRKMMDRSPLTIFFLLMAFIFLSLSTSARNCYGACLIKDGQFYGIHENKYFPMNSVMKFPQALFVADWMKKHNIRLSDSVKVTKEELIDGTWSPKLGDIQTSKSFTYAELLSYSLMLSDNNACDVLFKRCGDPKTVEAYVRSLGFKRIHIRKTERQMREDHSCCRHNKTTPKDMTLLLQWLYKTGSGYTHNDGTADIGDAGIYLLSDGSKLPICVFVKGASSDHIIAEISQHLQYMALTHDTK